MNSSNLGVVLTSQAIGMEVRDMTGQIRIGQIADFLLQSSNAAMPLTGTNTGSTTGGATGTLGTTGAVSGNIGAASGNTGTASGNIGNRTGVGGAAAANPNIAFANPNPTNGLATSGLGQNGMAGGLGQSGMTYALIQVDNAASGRSVVVPWQLLSFQGTYFVLALDQSRLAQAPSVMANDPRLRQSSDWLNQVGTFFANDLQQARMQNPTGVSTPLQNGTNSGVSPAGGARTTQPTTGTRR